MTISTITFPNGLEYEAKLEETGSPCLLCASPAVAFHMPKYEHIEAAVIDQFCGEHLTDITDQIRDMFDGKS